MEQLNLFDTIHESCSCYETGPNFISLSEVPCSHVCLKCGKTWWRNIPPPVNEPDILGYITATWAWHYIHGNAWTNDLED